MRACAQEDRVSLVGWVFGGLTSLWTVDPDLAPPRGPEFVELHLEASHDVLQPVRHLGLITEVVPWGGRARVPRVTGGVSSGQ